MENKKICLALGLPGGIIALLFGVLSVFAGGGAPAIYSLILVAFGVMGIVFSVFAVKRKWPRVALIVIGAIVIVLSFASVSGLLPGGLMLAAGIVGLVGKKRDKDSQNTVSEAQTAGAPVSDGAEVVAEGADRTVGVEKTDKAGGVLGRFKSKFVKSGEDKGRVAVFVALTLFYVVLLAVSLMLYFTDGFGAFGNNGTGNVITLAYAMIVPAYLIYFGSHNPFKLGKKVSLFFIVFGVVAVVACAAAGIYIIFSQYADTVDQLVKIFICFALVLADAGYIFAYVYWCKGLGSGWYAGIGIAGVVLFPIVAVLAVVVFVLCIILFFLRGAFSVAKTGLSGNSFVEGFKAGYHGYDLPSETIEINDGGYTRTLTPEGYDAGYPGGNRYKYRDDLGREWYSDDNGTTFYRDK